MNIYDTGDVVRLSAAFTDTGGTAADPTAVVIRVKDPDGTVTTPSVQKDSTGNYHSDFTIASSGNHYWRAEGTGAVTAAAEGTFQVRMSNVL